MERQKNKNWSEDDDRDDMEFWEHRSRNISRVTQPSYAGMFIGDDDEADLTIGTKNDEGTTAMQIFDVEI